MASKTSTNGPLRNVYESRIGDPETDSEIWGYWIFALGVVFGFVGVLMTFNSQSAGGIRQWAIMFASTGLVLLIAGPIIRLPLQRMATLMVYVGVAISAVAIVWFVAAYPAQWNPQTGNLRIIGLYAAGVLVLAASGAFVPVMKDRDKMEAEVSALEAELDELQGKLNDSEADEAERAAEMASLRETLSDTETDNAELEDEVDQLQDDIADSAADEADLAAPLSDRQASQAQFELYEDFGEQWRWRLRHRNGNILASSGEGYARKTNAQQGMQAVRRDAFGATVLLIESEDDLPEEASEDKFVFPDVAESQATFELYEDEGGEYRWRLRHDNGNIIADGREGYVSRAGAETAIEGIQEYVGSAEYLQPEPTAIEVYEDTADKWRWRLRHRNGNVLASSGDSYADRGGARRAIDRLRDGISDIEVEVYEDEGGGFRWRVAGGDDKVKVDSGSYESRDGAEEAVERVRSFMPNADLLDIGEAAFEVYEDEAGEHRWRLRHRNGNILAGDGQGYADRSGVWAGIESVKRNAPNAEFEETDG